MNYWGLVPAGAIGGRCDNVERLMMALPCSQIVPH